MSDDFGGVFEPGNPWDDNPALGKPDKAIVKARAAAIEAKLAHKQPGPEPPHDEPDMSHPDQSQNDAEAAHRGLHKRP